MPSKKLKLVEVEVLTLVQLPSYYYGCTTYNYFKATVLKESIMMGQ